MSKLKITGLIIALGLFGASLPLQAMKFTYEGFKRGFAKTMNVAHWGIVAGMPLYTAATRIHDYYNDEHPYNVRASNSCEERIKKTLIEQGMPQEDVSKLKVFLHPFLDQWQAIGKNSLLCSYRVDIDDCKKQLKYKEERLNDPTLSASKRDEILKVIEKLKKYSMQDPALFDTVLAHESKHLRNNDLTKILGVMALSPLVVHGFSRLAVYLFRKNTGFNSIPGIGKSLLKIPSAWAKIYCANLCITNPYSRYEEAQADEHAIRVIDNPESHRYLAQFLTSTGSKMREHGFYNKVNPRYHQWVDTLFDFAHPSWERRAEKFLSAATALEQKHRQKEVALEKAQQ